MSEKADCKRHLMLHDITIFSIMAVLAACGLIYEYLLSHYAGRILGAIETVIFTMIGIMIVAMGCGAFAARFVKHHFTAFAWLELLIAFIGSTSVLFLAAVMALTNQLPQAISEIYGLPPDLLLAGGVIKTIGHAANLMPYIIGFLLGFFIGMEIPLIARVRETIHRQHLRNNVGSIYGADYIGAGIGAAIWVWFMLSMESTWAGVLTASANLTIGIIFYLVYRRRIKYGRLLLGSHVLVGCIVIIIGWQGSDWEATMEDMLYEDEVIYRHNTKHQHITITRRVSNPDNPPIYTFFLNGRTQFASNDERLYHSMMVYPAMAASAQHNKVLIIGGGDGLALRDVLRWNPQKVTLLDLDGEVIKFFSHPVIEDGEPLNQSLLKLNRYAFSDPRVDIQIGDAFLTVDTLLQQEAIFDTIIVDLPDPGHPDLNKMYSARFYSKLKHLLAGDGAIAIQSTSPYHAKRTFLCIGKTVKYAGFLHVEQYHWNVPSFGDWGWTIATKNGASAKARLHEINQLLVDDGWTTKAILLAAFAFGQHYFAELNQIKVNRLGSNIAYQYHHQDWQMEQGIYWSEKPANDN